MQTLYYYHPHAHFTTRHEKTTEKTASPNDDLELKMLSLAGNIDTILSSKLKVGRT